MTIPSDPRQNYPPLALQSTSASGAMVPTYLGPTETFTVPENRQALFAQLIDNEGTLILDGTLIGVD